MCYVGLTSLKSLKLTNVYPNNKKKSKNNKVKRKPLELYELAGKKLKVGFLTYCCISTPLCANTKLQETKKTHRNTTLLYRHLAQLNHMTYKNILSSYHCNRTWCMAAIIATYFFFRSTCHSPKLTPILDPLFQWKEVKNVCIFELSYQVVHGVCYLLSIDAWFGNYWFCPKSFPITTYIRGVIMWSFS
jgi:hypothetical protein